MHDLAAGLLLELERLMLTSSVAGVGMATFLDTAPEFQAAPGAASALEAVSNRLYNDDVRGPLDTGSMRLSWLLQVHCLQLCFQLLKWRDPGQYLACARTVSSRWDSGMSTAAAADHANWEFWFWAPRARKPTLVWPCSVPRIELNPPRLPRRSC